MIRIQNISVPCSEHADKDLNAAIAKKLRISKEEVRNIRIVRRSVDARKKPDIRLIYTVEADVPFERKFLKAASKWNVAPADRETYCFPKSGERELKNRPVVVGSGPCGLFCAYKLAQNGYMPILLERGKSVEARKQDVEDYWKTGKLNPESNVQFGEGGAGTFSDGKLNSGVKDKAHRAEEVMQTFIRHGAPKEIAYDAKPHIGTDLLRGVIASMRNQILEWGGEVLFEHKVTALELVNGAVHAVRTENGKCFETENVVLALGHSARDTFLMLSELGLPMRPKAFAVGLRVLHPQTMINESQYGLPAVKGLSAADYKVTAHTSSGRGVYSFCMCPGGKVVNASSEKGRVAVNGMSEYARDSLCANSALIVTVTPDDYPNSSEYPSELSGMAFQRELEDAAYQAGNGKIPVQLYMDFLENRTSESFGDTPPEFEGETCFANLRSMLPQQIGDAIAEAMPMFGRKIKGFDRPDAIFAGVESRTSSPVHMDRDDRMESAIAGIYPCGEGAGFAGGILSAAIDGIKAAEAIAAKYQPWKEK